MQMNDILLTLFIVVLVFQLANWYNRPPKR
ncbi:MAG: hypothetical protein RLY30_972 [Pseudomonadota bacterium]|jgi:hypothetical protein